MQEIYLEEYIPVDLHVHTPASNCYNRKTQDIDQEYINLLEMYVQKGVKIIAITDHNSIKGYRELMRIKSETENRIKYWNELGDVELLRDKINLEQKKLHLFEEILILPGVEFEAFPGIHILLIFNPETDDITKIIEEFLYSNGYPLESQGKENIDVTGVSAVEIVNSAYELGAITIAAHIDSDKGALDKLEDSGRVQFLKNEALNGVQIVKPETIDYLKNLMMNEPYRRNKELSYMRFSDFHNQDEIDGKVSYFRLANLCFEGVRDVVVEHPELISFTPRIEDVDRIKNIVDNQETLSFESLKDKNIEDITLSICAILNRGKGTVAIGIGRKGSICGMKMPIDEIKDKISNIFKVYSKYVAYFKYAEDYFELGELTIVVIKIWSIGHIIFDCNDSVYVFDEKGKVKKATSNEIFELGEKNYRDSFLRINRVNKTRLRYIEEQTSIIHKAQENVELNRKILKYSVVAQNAFNIDLVNRRLNIEYEFNGLGTYEGNLFHVPFIDAHYHDCYSRISCPRFVASYDDEQLKNTEIHLGECAVINKCFEVHYIYSEDEYVIDGTLIIIFSLSDYLKEQYSLPAIILWLKSPILLYHQYTINGNYELITARQFHGVPIILNEEMKKGGIIDQIASEILLLEYSFLKEKEGVQGYELEQLMDTHNANVLQYVYRAEEEFVKILGITQKEYDSILEFAEKQNWNYFNKSNYEEIDEY